VTWDQGAPEPPPEVVCVTDYSTPDWDPCDPASPRWGRTTDGHWKGYKNGYKTYVGWDELTRRWGPLTDTGLRLKGAE
jgi:hypothetical protein